MNTVRDSWEKAGGSGSSFKEKLRQCSISLDSRKRRVFGNVKRRIGAVKAKLSALSELPRSQQNIDVEKALTEELDKWLAREEMLWRQGSRVKLLKQGDKNTKFFHARATQRKKKNHISKLRDQRGSEKPADRSSCGISSQHLWEKPGRSFVVVCH
ncbi:hypothetical protein QQ045_001742 [Rhodiola kirilowii]